MTPRKDIITEEEYTRRMNPSTTLPAEDSPGDSEVDAGAEFQMGVDYMPDDIDEEEDEDAESLELSTEDDVEMSEPSAEFHRLEEDDLPESAKVISANQPSPWMDRERNSDTN